MDIRIRLKFVSLSVFYLDLDLILAQCLKCVILIFLVLSDALIDYNFQDGGMEINFIVLLMSYLGSVAFYLSCSILLGFVKKAIDAPALRHVLPAQAYDFHA